MSKISMNLVIDASVASAAGGENAVHTSAKNARDFLSAVMVICHKMVMTSPLRVEWDKHESKFARKWRGAMVAKKKLVVAESIERADIRECIDNASTGKNNINAMRKDCHLLEAALLTDCRVVSLDDEVRGLYIQHVNVRDVKDIQWVNPDSDSEGALKWLDSGAPEENKYKLKAG